MDPHTVSTTEAARLSEHASALARIAARSVHPDGGFGWLDARNEVVVDRPVETWITCRMTHVLALEVMRGAEDLRPVLDVGHGALTGPLRDHERGGWFSAVAGPDDEPADKFAYSHAFVLLAAASLTAAGHPGGRALLDEALAVFDEHFWDERDGMVAERYDAAWEQLEPYRGLNANMHTAEALLAVGDVLDDPAYHQRALRIVERVVHGVARENDWRLPEHFDPLWNPLWEYNIDNKADQFRPYGVTIGHLLEWSRVALDLRTALGDAAPDWLLTDGRALLDAGLERGWEVDGAPGFVYTTDYDDRPVVRERLHWVVAEAIAAVATHLDVSGDEALRGWYDRLWAYVDEHVVDHELGGWFHELSPDNGPSEQVLWGKPDVYHPYQAALAPLLPGRVSFAGAVHRAPRVG